MPRLTPTVAGPGMAWRRTTPGTAEFDQLTTFLLAHDDEHQMRALSYRSYLRCWALHRLTGHFNEMTEERNRELMAVMAFNGRDSGVTIAVDPQYRRLGLGTKMLAYLMRMETDTAMLRVATTNEAGLAFAGRYSLYSSGPGFNQYLVSYTDFGDEDFRCDCNPCVRRMVFTLD